MRLAAVADKQLKWRLLQFGTQTLGHGDLLKWNPHTGAEVTSAAEREALEKEVWGFSGPIRLRSPRGCQLWAGQ